MTHLAALHLSHDGPLPAHLREAAMDADMREWRRARPPEEKAAGLIERLECKSVTAAEEAASEWRRAKIEIRKSRAGVWDDRLDHRDEALACLVRRLKWRHEAALWRAAANMATEELL